jgi:uncharacterized protein (TIGR02145 family)
MIEFQIKGSGNLKQVSLSGANPLACAGYIDLTQPLAEGTPYTITKTNSTKYVTVNLGSQILLSSETATSIYMMVLPGTQSDLLIALNIDNIWYEISKAQPDGGFLRGKKYVVELNTGDMNVNVFTDSRDSNTYSYKTIGSQIWMTENLAYLPSVSMELTETEASHYYVYGYNGSDVNTAKETDNYINYGVLYNWYAAQVACPDGWHLPSTTEWETLTDDLGGKDLAGGKMKETGTTYWNSPNTGATNESGFTALGGGYRLGAITGVPAGFYEIREETSFYSSANTGDMGVSWAVYTSDAKLRSTPYNKRSAYYVRCIKDD